MPRSVKSRHSPVRAEPCGPVLDLNSHVATKVAIFANRLSRAASRFYRERYGIGVVEWRLMMFIGHVTETRANCICRETDLDKGAVSRSLGVLQRMGIVSVKEDGADSRRNNVALTSKGRAVHNRLVRIALERQRELLAGLTPDEVRAFTGIIDRLQAKVAHGEPVAEEPLPERSSRPRPQLTAAPRRAGLPRRRVSAQRG